MYTYQLFSAASARLQVPESGFYLSELSAPKRWPILTFLPTGFEPQYAYPLLVFLHGRGASERQLIPWMPALSRRNYVAIALRGPYSLRGKRVRDSGYVWLDSRRPAEEVIEDYLFAAVEETSRRLRIHPRRIFLVGFCEGAQVAYRVALRHPHHFGGLVVLNGTLPSTRPLLRLPEARSLPVFIAHGIANAVIPLSAARKAAQLLHLAGLAVDLRLYPTTHRLHPAMLQDANHWLMNLVTATP
ncbi:MAG: dienelactone hydrolase family protein [Gemmatales bacterium]|nr:dienelactone hydrolase family protein [Gemmatales bacterium]MDW8174235.1 dienelactone hydrolase family protein [Gemmatales bacterium]